MTELAVVTATLDLDRAGNCLASWRRYAVRSLPLYVVSQSVHATTAHDGQWVRSSADQDGALHVQFYKSAQVLGVVPAFAIGVQKALDDGAQIVACLHDDLEIQQQGWDEEVVRLFKACPRAGLCGFGGGKGLGSDDIYQTPYNPMQLARQGFRSNMRDAEAHGIRSRAAEPVACLDGFAQIGLADFWRCLQHPSQQPHEAYRQAEAVAIEGKNLFDVMAKWGVIHHFYDGMLGCFAKRLGYQVWYLPIACHHYGGRTAVGDARYQSWARLKKTGTTEGACGDAGFWQEAHQIGYDQFRDVLPIRT